MCKLLLKLIVICNNDKQTTVIELSAVNNCTYKNMHDNKIKIINNFHTPRAVRLDGDLIICPSGIIVVSIFIIDVVTLRFVGANCR